MDVTPPRSPTKKANGALASHGLTQSPLPLRDWHLWQPPDGPALLWHVPSCSAVQLSEEATRLFELALEDEPSGYGATPEGAEETPTSAGAEFEALIEQLQQISAPPPPTVERAPERAELLLYGNLACNMSCAYCSSREARAEAQAGKAPSLMPLETMEQSVKFIVEEMRDTGASVDVNFSLRHACTTPLLLTFACLLHEEGLVNATTTYSKGSRI